jgi:hypothetical protein
VPIVRIEEVELEVLPGSIRDVLAIHRDPEGEIPLRDSQLREEDLQVGANPPPSATLSDEGTGCQPVPERLDRILDARGLHEFEEVPSEKGPIEAGFEMPRCELLAHILDQECQRVERLLRVMDIALAVDHGQELTGLGQMGGQWVVGFVLRVMGIEAARRALREQSCAQHGPIEIDRGTGQTGFSCRVVGHLPQQVIDPSPHRFRRLLQRIRHRAIRGQLMQAREAKEQWIPLQDPQVAQPRPAEQQHAHQGQRDAKRAVVAIKLANREDFLEPLRKALGNGERMRTPIAFYASTFRKAPICPLASKRT